MFFDIGKHDFDRLASQPIDRPRFVGLHSGPMRNDEVFVLTAPQTPTAFLAGCTVLSERAGLTR